MLLRHHPEYPWFDYVRDHERRFDALERRDRNAPLGRLGGAYVTGTTIVVDGGADAWGLAVPPPEPERR